MKKIICLIPWLLGAMWAQANVHHVDMHFNDDTLSLSGGTYFDRSDVHLKALYYYKKDDAIIAGGRLNKVHDLDIHHFEFGVQPLFIFLDSDQSIQSDFKRTFAATLGGQYQVEIIRHLSASVESYFAPSVLASSGLNRYFAYDIRLSYELMPDLNLFGGYESIGLKYEQEVNAGSSVIRDDYRFDQKWYAGLSMTF
jgi:hypothetical protein